MSDASDQIPENLGGAESMDHRHAHAMHQSHGLGDNNPVDNMLKNAAIVELNNGIGHSERVARDLGFVMCDPPYNREGALPKKNEHNGTDVDIISVAAVGADAKSAGITKPRYSYGTSFDTAAVQPYTGSWIRNIRKDIPRARVLLYDGHGECREGDKLLAFARKCLKCLHLLRKHDLYQPCLDLITAVDRGLVAKLALIEASRGNLEGKSLLADCYATRHQGSSYLSAPEFTISIKTAMSLHNPLPKSLQTELQINSELLRTMASSFKRIAADLVIWTFYETEDTDLTIPMTAETDEIPILAPVTSIKSAILDFYHEVDCPLWTDHVGCASFSGENSEAMQDFILDLKKAVQQAHNLSTEKHVELNIKGRVEVEIHGFYKGIPQPATSESPIRLWTIRKTFGDFVALGPSKCLEERLQEVFAPPRRNQFVRSTSTRAPSLDSRLATNTAVAAMDIKLAKLPSQEVGAFQRRQIHVSSADEENSQSQQIPKAMRNRIVGFLTPTENTSKDTSGPSKYFRRGSLQEPKSAFPARPQKPRTGVVTETTKVMSPPNVIISDPNDSNSETAPYAGGAEVPPSNLADLPSAAILPQRSGVLSSTGTEYVAMAQPESQQSTPNPVWNNYNLDPGLLLSPKAGSRESPPGSVRRPHKQKGDPVFSDFAPASRFVKPDVASRKLTWIHVPFNNPSWVSSSTTSPLSSPATSAAFGAADLHIALYLPYLHWDTYKLLVKRRHLVKKRLEYNRSRPVPERVAEMDLEHQVTWIYLGRDPPFNCRRTLDQFGYPNLHDTRARDDDQMLYKMTKKQRKSSGNTPKSSKFYSRNIEEDLSDDKHRSEDEGGSQGDLNSDDDILDGTVLIVDQLWLWVINDGESYMLTDHRVRIPVQDSH
ncbi:hypothetical protein MMC18_005151 [Xylographa bjoerkii]|nr:hypothetical protein [Xylographa bjoerkii]